MEADDENQATEDDAQGITFEEPTTAADEANIPQTEEPIIELTEDDQTAKEEEENIPIVEPVNESIADEEAVEGDIVVNETGDEITAGESLPEEIVAEEPVTEETSVQENVAEESNVVEADGDEVVPDEVKTEIEEPPQEEAATDEPAVEGLVAEEDALEEGAPEEIAETTPAADEAGTVEAIVEEQTVDEQATDGAPIEGVPAEEAPTEDVPEEGDAVIEEEVVATDDQPQIEDVVEAPEQEEVKIESTDVDATQEEDTEAAEIKEVVEGGEESDIVSVVEEEPEKQPEGDQEVKAEPEELEEVKEQDQKEEDQEGDQELTKKETKVKEATFDAPEEKIHQQEVTDAPHRTSDTSSIQSQTKDKAAPPSKKYKKTFPYRGDDLDEARIQNQLKVPAPQHEYFGLIFSQESKRPPAYYHNYFLPFQKQPHANQHIKVVGKHIPTQLGKDNLVSTNSLPLSTIKIRWMLNRRHTVYKASDLYAYLTSRFGAIENIYQVSSNSAIVVFAELASANAAMKARGLGYPWDPLIADWWEPRMNNYAYLKKYLSIEDTAVHDLRIFENIPQPPR